MHRTSSRTPSWALSLIFVARLGLAVAAPQLAFPINSQVPPVAYVSQPYTFAFSATTFASVAPQVSYAITDGPKWLGLDSASRQFCGVPDHGDIGATTFQLVASDSTGQSSTSVALVVLESPELTVNEPVLPQLERNGPTSAPNSLLVHPQAAFNISFEKGITFGGITPGTRYYAVSTDNTPLPPWVQFDESKLLFSGTAPAFVNSLAGPQIYGLRLIASNVPGFAESSIEFNIVVNRRVLAFLEPSQNISTSPGVRFESADLRTSLTLDGESVPENQIANIDADVPTWVTIHKSRLSLSGTPDASNASVTVTISITDIHGDVANATVFLQNLGGSNASLGTIAFINVTTGEYFSYALVTPTFSPSIQAVPDLSNQSSWLKFDPRTWVLSGVVPSDQPLLPVAVPITFKNDTTTLTGEVSLQVLPGPGISSASSAHITATETAPQASATSTTSGPATSSRNQNKTNGHVLRVILAIVLSVFGACLVLLVIVCCLWRKKQKKREPSKTSVENGSEVANSHSKEAPTRLGPSIGNLDQPTGPQKTPPTRPPRIDLLWSNNSLPQSRQRLSTTARPGPLSQHRISQVFANDGELLGWSEAASVAERTRAFPSGITPINQATLPLKAPSAVVSRSSVSDRPSRTGHASKVSRQSVLPPPVGLPDRRSGAGHGAGILVPAEVASSRMSWRNTWATNPSSEDRRTTVVLESFPTPPGDLVGPTRPPSRGKQPVPLLRVVSEDGNETLSFGEQRQKWHTERARARLEGTARFSNAGSARMIVLPRTLRHVRSSTSQGDRDSSLSSAKPHLADIPSREHSWSRWSGSGPAVHAPPGVRSPSGSYIGNGLVLRSKASNTSSRQFDSVTSSESHWDDENLVIEENEDGVKRWQTDNSSQESPRLPFSPVPPSRENPSNTNNGVEDTRQRLADRRKHASVEEGGLQRSQGSQRGSFCFI